MGQHRLPNFTDRPFLPYIECIVQETLRYNHAGETNTYLTKHAQMASGPAIRYRENLDVFQTTHSALGVPHRLLRDDIYRDMLIPKGTVVFANAR